MAHKSRLICTVVLFVLLSLTAKSDELDVYKYADNRHVSDIVLIYNGGNNRLKWTVSDVEPYVTHTYLDGHTSWFYPGFAFLEFYINDRYMLHVSKANAKYATKDDWKQYIDKTMDARTCMGAFERCIENQKSILGNPPFRHKVIMGVPAPIENQKDWGVIGKKNMNFSKNSDRVNAIKWYIDEAIQRFKSLGYKNIDLEGFYWIEEDMNHSSMEMMNDISSYIHNKGYKFYWMPYQTGKGVAQWRLYGFDYTYIQSGYTIKPSLEFDRVTNQTAYANRRGMGIVVEFDGNLFNDPNTFVKRMNETLNQFEKDGVTTQSAMAYYEGGRLIKDIASGKHRNYKPSSRQLRSIQEVIDRIAEMVAQRSSASGYTSPPSSQPDDNSQQNDNNGSDDWRNPDYWHF